MGFGVLLASLVVVAALGLFATQRVHDGLRVVYEDRMVALQELAQVNQRMLRNRILVMDMISSPDADNLRARNEELQANLAEVEKRWAAYAVTYMDQQEKALAQAFADARGRYVQEGILAARDAVMQARVDDARRLYAERVRVRAREAQDVLDKLIRLQVDIGAAEYAAAGRTQQTLVVITSAVVVLTLLAGVLLAWGVTQSVARPVGEATRLARRIQEGDLSTPIEPKGRDEVAELLQALQGMQQALARVVGAVRRNAESVATASTQIAQGNQDLSGRTEQQAAGLEQAAASMEELGATVRQNADSARQGNQLAQGASEVAQRGGAVVAEVVDTMKGINDSSRRIADIIGVIDGIAFQTNILALNAAVEAARAGEQGRGFAVVAGEVRSLAQRSAEAAREIKTLITASVERVEQGSALVDQAGATMQDIVSHIRRVTDLMAEISNASEQQRSGVEQVGEAVAQMDQATQQNAALVEQSAAAAESLSRQAEQLVQAVAVFRLQDHGLVAQPQRAALPAQAPAVAVKPAWSAPPVARPAPARPAVVAAAVPTALAATPAAQPVSVAAASDDWETF